MKKTLIILALTGLTIFSSVGCTSGTAREQNMEQYMLYTESNKQIGMPNITEFYEKRIAKEIWELRDRPDLTTYAYNQNVNGKYVYLGRCMGFGLPYTTQYTNPISVDGTKQADPNGLFNSETTDATWLILINEETNEREIIYAESDIIVTQSKLPKRLVESWSLPSDY